MQRAFVAKISAAPPPFPRSLQCTCFLYDETVPRAQDCPHCVTKCGVCGSAWAPDAVPLDVDTVQIVCTAGVFTSSRAGRGEPLRCTGLRCSVHLDGGACPGFKSPAAAACRRPRYS
jgi:hypothetical protein